MKPLSIAADVHDSLTRDRLRRYKAQEQEALKAGETPQAALEAACKAGRAEYDLSRYMLEMQDTPPQVMTTIGLMPAPKGNPKTVVMKCPHIGLVSGNTCPDCGATFNDELAATIRQSSRLLRRAGMGHRNDGGNAQ